VAKAATETIPIVFTVPEDPVQLGLVASLSRPGTNLTGVNLFVGELVPKRLDLLRELVPAMRRIAVLVNPAYPTRAELQVSEVESAARAMGLQKPKSSAPAAAAKSTQRSHHLRATGPTPCSSTQTRSLLHDVCSLPLWRPGIRFQRRFRYATPSMPAD
jgi:ABC-type uncharacterized transport system substrate-binding protein